MHRIVAAALFIGVTGVLVAEQVSERNDKGKAELAKVQHVVGAWRGVAQPRRGSTQGSWVEEIEWSWNFDGERPALVGVLEKGKHFESLRLTAAEEGSYELLATTGDGRTIKYAGRLDEEQKLVLNAQKPEQDDPARVTFRFVAGGNRMLVLLERQAAGSEQLVRLAEVGYTRQGSGFGAGQQGRECVVTGGTGTIEVTHAGRTYYVCCTGCRDYFNANPAEVLAEYAERKKAEAQE